MARSQLELYPVGTVLRSLIDSGKDVVGEILGTQQMAGTYADGSAVCLRLGDFLLYRFGVFADSQPVADWFWREMAGFNRKDMVFIEYMDFTGLSDWSDALSEAVGGANFSNRAGKGFGRQCICAGGVYGFGYFTDRSDL